MSEPSVRPRDVDPGTPLGELVEHYHRHHAVVVDSQAGIGEPPPALVVASHALRALAYQHALAERALDGRSLNMVAALSHGATVEQVAEATGWGGRSGVAALRAALRRWAGDQLQFGLITAEQHSEVLALVGAS